MLAMLKSLVSSPTVADVVSYTADEDQGMSQQTAERDTTMFETFKAIIDRELEG